MGNCTLILLYVLYIWQKLTVSWRYLNVAESGRTGWRFGVWSWLRVQNIVPSSGMWTNGTGAHRLRTPREHLGRRPVGFQPGLSRSELGVTLLLQLPAWVVLFPEGLWNRTLQDVLMGRRCGLLTRTGRVAIWCESSMSYKFMQSSDS